MKNSWPALRIGTRSSKLAIRQTDGAIAKLREFLPEFKFKAIPFSSPGDRNRQLDLRDSPPDFFTRDLDDAILSQAIDGAIHSAKDVPLPLRNGLDWFWLPWREDSRDALVSAPGQNLAKLIQASSGQFRIGVSSQRREDYCRKKFPAALLLPIRGNIDHRL